MSSPHPELPNEQAYIAHAFECLKEAEQSAQRLVDEEHAGGNRFVVRKLHELGGQLLRRRKDAEERVCFARIDREDGEAYYIGREHIRDNRPGHTRKPVVISWYVDAAVPYYEAHPDDPQGLVRKRRFELEGATLAAIDDEVLKTLPDGSQAARESRPDGAPVPRPGAIRDDLLRDLERARTPEMRDMVPTIQREQFAQIRATTDGILVVQGGPGTGKTSVALQRAAWLAFNQQDMGRRGGILVVGPNPAFMQYVAAVLPGLGQQSVTQAAVDRLVVAQDPTGRTVSSNRHETDEDLPFLKGDARLADVIARFVEQRVREPAQPVEANFGGIQISLGVSQISNLIRTAQSDGSRRRPYMEARTRFRTGMRRLAEQAYRGGSQSRSSTIDDDQLERSLNAASGPWFNALERIWPTMSAPQLVHELYTNETRLRAAADGVLDQDEQTALLRKEVDGVRDQPWTVSDLPLVDEADTALNGGRSRSSYGYVIVDEAQDLTPMQLRMVGRRSRGGLTLVGDLAQATGAWTYASWKQLAAQVPGSREMRVSELTVGYRVPEPIIKLASTLLPKLAPGLQQVDAVRQGSQPKIEGVPAEELALSVAVTADSLREGDRTVGVIVPASLLSMVRATVSELGLQVGDIERDGIERQVTLLPAGAAKGLEFDHVLVVEPAAIAEELPHGLGKLYVALTRATQRLSVLHSRGLPEPLVHSGAIEPEAEAAVISAPVTDVASPTATETEEDDSRTLPTPEIPVMELGGAFSEALVFAKLKHGHQARRGTAVPYLSHLLAVSSLVLDDGGTEEEAIAALLHDIAEDHGGEAAVMEVAARFGDTVAGVVALCTDPDVGEDWREVKKAHLEILSTAQASVRRVSLAEKLDNARKIVRELREVGDEVWPRMRVESEDLLWYFGELADFFEREHPGAMATELARHVEEMHALTQ